MSEEKDKVFDFIENNFPNYSGSQLIRDWNDLGNLVEGEYEQSDVCVNILKEEYGGDYEKALPEITKDYIELHIKVLDGAIKGFKDNNRLVKNKNYYEFTDYFNRNIKCKPFQNVNFTGLTVYVNDNRVGIMVFELLPTDSANEDDLKDFESKVTNWLVDNDY